MGGGGGGGENTTKPRVPATVRAAAWQVHDRKDNLVLTSLTSADHSILFSPARDQLCPPTFLCAFMFLLGIRWMNTMILMHLVTTFSCKQFLMKALKHFYLKKKRKKERVFNALHSFLPVTCRFIKIQLFASLTQSKYFF